MGIFKSVAWAQLYTRALTSNSTWENTVCASCQAVFLFWGKCKRKLPSPRPRLLSPFAWLKHSHVEFHPKNRQILLLSVFCFFLWSFLYIHLPKNLPAWWQTRFIFKIFWQHQYSAIKHGLKDRFHSDCPLVSYLDFSQSFLKKIGWRRGMSVYPWRR